MVLVNLFMDGIAPRYALVSTGSTRTDWMWRNPSPFALSLSKGPCIVSLSNGLTFYGFGQSSYGWNCTEVNAGFDRLSPNGMGTANPLAVRPEPVEGLVLGPVLASIARTVWGCHVHWKPE